MLRSGRRCWHNAACGQTEWPNGADIAVRIGMHLGRAEERDGNYFGPPVNRSARVMAIAQGRQIVVTATVRAAAETWLPDDITLVPLGEVELKDITEPIEVFSVASQGVDVPPRPDRAPALVAGNLPERVATLVGRTRAVSDVVDALDNHRLVTLVGVGGVGKTTLATDVGRSVRRFTGWCLAREARTDPGGSCGRGRDRGRAGLVGDGRHDRRADRQRAARPAHGPAARQLRPRPRRGRRRRRRDPRRHARTCMCWRRVASHCGSPENASSLCSRSPCGSRVPGRATRPNCSCDAPRRAARALDPAAHGAAIDELCRRLDGLPLAIELAAAKTRAFDPSRLVDLLDHRFQLLGADHRSGDARHQTLRATFDWSYELLDEGDRLVFDRLGVIAGPFDIDDAVALCA